jgi:hypothetical protein
MIIFGRVRTMRQWRLMCQHLAGIAVFDRSPAWLSAIAVVRPFAVDCLSYSVIVINYENDVLGNVRHTASYHQIAFAEGSTKGP